MYFDFKKHVGSIGIANQGLANQGLANLLIIDEISSPKGKINPSIGKKICQVWLKILFMVL